MYKTVHLQCTALVKHVGTLDVKLGGWVQKKLFNVLFVFFFKFLCLFIFYTTSDETFKWWARSYWVIIFLRRRAITNNCLESLWARNCSSDLIIVSWMLQRLKGFKILSLWVAEWQIDSVYGRLSPLLKLFQNLNPKHISFKDFAWYYFKPRSCTKYSNYH